MEHQIVRVLIPGRSPDLMKSTQIFMNVLFFLHVFVLHDIPGMFQRYYFLKETKFLIQLCQKLFIFTCSKTKTNVRMNAHS